MFMDEDSPKHNIPHPSNLAQHLFRAILEDHANLSKFKKDCFCHDHNGPHAVHLSRKRLLDNYSFLFDSLRKNDIPEDLYMLFHEIFKFCEEERHRQSILVKDLKMYVRELPETLAN